MLKFEYHFKDNTLFIQSPGFSPQPITKTFSGNYNAQGFILEPTNHWIAFTIYPDKIRIFYKQITIPSQESLWSLEQVNYYRKELPKEELQSNGDSFDNERQSRRTPLPNNLPNPDYLKYALYALSAVWMVIMLIQAQKAPTLNLNQEL